MPLLRGSQLLKVSDLILHSLLSKFLLFEIHEFFISRLAIAGKETQPRRSLILKMAQAAHNPCELVMSSSFCLPNVSQFRSPCTPYDIKQTSLFYVHSLVTSPFNLTVLHSELTPSYHSAVLLGTIHSSPPTYYCDI